MKALAFLMTWVVVTGVVVGAAFAGRRGERPKRDLSARQMLGSVPVGVRLIVGLVVLGAAIVVPVLVTAAASDRLPSGAGTYTLNSSNKLRDGRLIFRQTCASCHTLSAAGARGVYGPNLDSLGVVNAGRVAGAIDNGGSTGKIMPAGLLDGTDKKLVADYVAAVAGK